MASGCRYPQLSYARTTAGITGRFLLDAIITGQQAGQILSLNIDELEHHAGITCSSHGLGLIEAIELTRALAQLPAVVQVLGISVTDANQDAAAIAALALPAIEQAIIEFRHALKS